MASDDNEPEDGLSASAGAPAAATVVAGGADPAAGRRQRLGRLAIGAGIALLVVAAVVAKVGVGTVVAVGEGIVHLVRDGIRPLPVPRVVTDQPPPRQRDGLADLAPAVRQALLQPAPLTGQQFRYALALPPAELCRRVAAAGIPTSPWAEEGVNQWSCMSDLVPVPGTRTVIPDAETLPDGAVAEPSRSTVFFTARGRDAATLQVIRFKLNLDDPSVDRAGRVLLIRLLDDLAGPLAWSAPPAVRLAIERHTRLTLTDRGVTVEIHPEGGTVRRLNVVLLLGPAARSLPADRFIAAPPLPPEMAPPAAEADAGMASAAPSPMPTAVPTGGTSPLAPAPVDASPTPAAPAAAASRPGSDQPTPTLATPVPSPAVSPPGTRPDAE